MIKATTLLGRVWGLACFVQPSLWLLVVVGAVPLLVSAGGASPPWPGGIAWVTSLTSILAAIWDSRRASRATDHRHDSKMGRAVLLAIAAAVAYVFLLSRFTFTLPTTGEVGVKGFLCTPEAALVYPGNCPDNDLEALTSAEYESARIWRQWTIDLVRVGMLVAWFVSFTMASMLVARIGQPPFAELLRRVPPPYEGLGPHYFMSYAHADLAQILPVLTRIVQDGHLVWFDKGIPGATPWDEVLSRQIHQCRAVIVFLSRVAVSSKWVQREVMFADALDKPIFCIRLEPFTLSPPLDMVLARIQMIEGNPEHVSSELRRVFSAYSPTTT